MRQVLARVQSLLSGRYKITHSTVQVEFAEILSDGSIKLNRCTTIYCSEKAGGVICSGITYLSPPLLMRNVHASSPGVTFPPKVDPLGMRIQSPFEYEPSSSVNPPERTKISRRSSTTKGSGVASVDHFSIHWRSGYSAWSSSRGYMSFSVTPSPRFEVWDDPFHFVGVDDLLSPLNSNVGILPQTNQNEVTFGVSAGSVFESFGVEHIASGLMVSTLIRENSFKNEDLLSLWAIVVIEISVREVFYNNSDSTFQLSSGNVARLSNKVSTTGRPGHLLSAHDNLLAEVSIQKFIASRVAGVDFGDFENFLGCFYFCHCVLLNRASTVVFYATDEIVRQDEQVQKKESKKHTE